MHLEQSLYILELVNFWIINSIGKNYSIVLISLYYTILCFAILYLKYEIESFNKCY